MNRTFLVIILGCGILMLVGCGSYQKGTAWEPSPVFDVTPPESPHPYRMRGIEGRIGYIDAPLQVGIAQKCMWHFWGDPQELVAKPFELVATSQTGEQIKLDVADSPLPGRHNTAQAHSRTRMNFPSEGLWKVDAFVAGELYGSVIVEVTAP